MERLRAITGGMLMLTTKSSAVIELALGGTAGLFRESSAYTAPNRALFGRAVVLIEQALAQLVVRKTVA